MSLPTAHQLDAQAAAALSEALRCLRRAFAEGIGKVTDFPESREVLKQLQQTLEQEQAVEARLGMRARLAQQAQQELPNSGAPGQRVCCLVDGSLNSFAALRWALEHVVEPEDDVYLLTVAPYEDYSADAEQILMEAHGFAHNAGVKAARLHPRSLSASCSSRTGGVGECVRQFVESSGVGLLVLGSRGMGSIRRSLMGTLGMGSLSEFCVQHLTCPVLVIKEGAEQEAAAAAVAAGQAQQ